MQSYKTKAKKYGTEGAPTSLSKWRSEVWVCTNEENMPEKQVKYTPYKLCRTLFHAQGVVINSSSVSRQSRDEKLRKRKIICGMMHVP